MKTKVMILEKGVDYAIILGESIDIVSKFVYHGTVFTTEGSFSEAQETLAGLSLKAIV